ncbi:MAG TPA: EthD family reductase [Opitutus sp.]|nr:EthD family reductase [Opitutus sp.]
MIRVNVLYPAQPDATFDWDYYLAKHIPLVTRLLTPALQETIVEQGLGGEAPGSPPVYVAMAHLKFESIAAFQTAFGPHADEITADIANYTTITPLVQISEVK